MPYYESDILFRSKCTTCYIYRLMFMLCNRFVSKNIVSIRDDEYLMHSKILFRAIFLNSTKNIKMILLKMCRK